MQTSALSDRADAARAWAFCYEILPDVSRTFALTIPVLAPPLADSVCVAYLLCRIADTIEDRNDLEPAPRAWLYQRFAAIVAAPPRFDLTEPTDPRISEFLERWPPDANPAYQTLVARLADVIAAYASLGRQHRAAINECVQEMVSGMSDMTHPPRQGGMIYVCEDLDQLERYCHYVAGTVGLMLTRLFDLQLGPGAAFATSARLEQGRRFGLGLQLTNILKDHENDWARGTSFFPATWLRSSADGGLLALHRSALVRRTVEHLQEAQAYTLALPGEEQGMRLFCLWALWMAMATLREVARASSGSPKIRRDEVASIINYTRRHVRDDDKLQARFSALRDEVARELFATREAKRRS